MNRVHEPPSRNPFSGTVEMTETRNIPVLSASISPSDHPAGDPMDVSPPASAAMGPPSQSSPEIDQGHTNGNTLEVGNAQNATSTQPTGAAAAAQQPKVVQTAFIHKLYSMLQDSSIQHLISWSSSNESFVMSPSSDFSKVLAQYFKHTNISSFVRQLNMYGFHKVSDVFHTGSPDSPMWEFRHGNGNFRKGDLSGLREIKRRASRHALIHRDSFSVHKNNASQPGTPAEPPPEAPDNRMINLEHSLYEVHSRLSRMEDQHALLNSRCQALTDSLIRCHQWANSMSHFMISLVPDPENAIHRDAANMQREVARQLDAIRALESPTELFVSGRQPYFANLTVDTGAPLSPRQVGQDSRRTSIARPPMPPHISVSPHRFGSVSGANTGGSGFSRPPPAPQQPAPHPLSISSPPGPNLGRRHTSADIRQHGWPGSGISPFSAGANSSQWPPSPQRVPTITDQQVQDVLSRYEMGKPRQPPDTRQPTPPLSLDPAQASEGGWAIGGPKFLRPTESLPATRRSSMASNVHSLLNPAETRERAEEEDAAMSEDRKRKRLQ
ncbi:Flocculation suppression protein [Ophidiomyces ophidiicola]|nr:Flocculation suppression protein [Ophidiomyces ophidiicola]KAI1942590.1 Flocculation suppression protein [Ophidiomyces ophidiicola]KAI1964776.1 Flocculation suppression protein [Ophidiomyces ophidiicola]